MTNIHEFLLALLLRTTRLILEYHIVVPAPLHIECLRVQQRIS
jgi:hypothetical protein